MSTQEKRGVFSSKLGFVLAAAGSAVGLGNIWRFPYLAAKYGGGAFLLTYIIFVVTLGFTIMMAEIAIGRKTQLSPIFAFKKLNKKYTIIGIVAVAVATIIVGYYNVIGGWVAKYLFTFATGNGAGAATDGFFSGFIGQPFEPLIWQALFIIAILAVVLNGVKKGIERVNKVLMPTLIILSIVIAVYTMTQPGAMEGVKYFLIPDFSKFSVEGVLAALGQVFYSLSLAMGIMITYGSYVKKEEDMEKAVSHIEIFDTGVALLAGLMIIPAVFAFSGGSQTELGQGPGLMFNTLPKVFDSMPMGDLIGALFFLMVLFAALTSAMSLLEVIVASVCDRFKVSRVKACLILGLIVFVIGIPSSLGNGIWSSFTIFGMDFLTFCDFLTNAVLMPLGAIATCLFIGWVIGVKSISDEVKLSSKFRREKLFNVMVKYVAPIAILAVLVSSILSNLGIITL
ncbi:sodium-dependent transporter [Candidatus Soleaferrea massiliensis]|uniref:sodium-dependent transporter n=1 Tax=Candidatus Soleaferrea massiliensis TaxID=1470354 RepID=UPI00058C1FB3|nr:sodium-dependent transporter [Candidatus Soleaferrea massiliensis]